jgi:hypothetical protein
MRNRTSEEALAEALHHVLPAFRRCALFGVFAILAGAVFGGLREMTRSIERDWASLFFLYGAGRGFLVGLLVAVGVTVVIPFGYFVVSFIRLRSSCHPKV